MIGDYRNDRWIATSSAHFTGASRLMAREDRGGQFYIYLNVRGSCRPGCVLSCIIYFRLVGEIQRYQFLHHRYRDLYLYTYGAPTHNHNTGNKRLAAVLWDIDLIVQDVGNRGVG